MRLSVSANRFCRLPLCQGGAATRPATFASSAPRPRRVEAARQNGVREGEAKAQVATAEKLEQERQAIRQAVEQFAQQRRSYFRRVETDVVTLALAIARKLLHREAQIDPLLLSGVVRVALEQIQAGSQVVLRTSPSQQETWQAFLSQLPETNREVAVVADEALAPGKLLLETSAGKAEIEPGRQAEGD